MADPDSLIQKIVQKVDRFTLDIVTPTIPRRLKKENQTLLEDADIVIFRKLWEKATSEERKKMEIDMDYELESSHSRSSRGYSRSRSSRSRSNNSLSRSVSRSSISDFSDDDSA